MRVYIDESDIHGKGVFAGELIVKHSNIGILYKDVIAPITGKRLPGVTKLSTFVNHSYGPNAKVAKLGRLFYLKALERIEIDEEITINYEKYAKLRNVRYES